MRNYFALLLMLWLSPNLNAQVGSVSAKVFSKDKALAFATANIEELSLGTTTDENGLFEIENVPVGNYQLVISYLGYIDYQVDVEIKEDTPVDLGIIELQESVGTLDEIVVTGTMKAVSRIESPVPVEVYKPTFFKKNPTPNIYEALQTVNGVRPQLNCQVCNTGDIHINGLEGPYTMVLIDGMPIVSSLSTVYGLSGIPNFLVDRMEIVKGPASSLYGSEAIGGLINIITKNPNNAPLFSADVMTNSWGETNTDLGLKFSAGKLADILTGVNYFNFQNRIDNNKDNFTDLALQERISIFQKWNFNRKDGKLFSLAGRYYYEDRWGGALDWNQSFRGGNEIYGESIFTDRWEILGQYELPAVENVLFSFSFNSHEQDSYYGDTPYLATQRIGFGQFTWGDSFKNHDVLVGSALRYTFYDDNTPATGGEKDSPTNDPDEIWLPGVFVQDEITLDKDHKLLLGLRYDYHQSHGNIFTPRLAYKWSITPNDIFRLNAGTGFRVVNLFTEDHAALTGARQVIIADELQPESSYNINLNYIKKLYRGNGTSINLEFSSWYTYFTNVILPDYETNTNQIIYDNLNGNSVTKGISTNIDMVFPFGLSILAGATLMDVSTEEDGVKERQILTERFTGTWTVSYQFWNNKMAVDYTGNVYGPMRLPLLGELDPRPAESPFWSIQNIQLTYKGIKGLEIYGGVKNLLDWTPWKNQTEPIIARTFDPFDQEVVFDEFGNALPTANNPNALTFDPSYVYAPNQGIRGFLGVRYSIQ